jgi:hypothetical protein
MPLLAHLSEVFFYSLKVPRTPSSEIKNIAILRYTPHADGRTNYQTIGQTTIDISISIVETFIIR